MELTARQRRFVAEYLVDLNASAAALRAGYSAGSAGAIGHENLKKPEIAAAVGEALAARTERTGVTVDRVVEELARIAFGDVRRLFHRDGTLKNPADLSDDLAAMLAGFEVDEGALVKVKLADKLRALELLARHLGMLKDKPKTQVKVRLVDLSGRGGG